MIISGIIGSQLFKYFLLLCNSIFFCFMFFVVAWLMAEAVIKRQDGAMFLFVAFPVVICSLLSGGRISKGAYFVMLLCFLCTYAGSAVRVSLGRYSTRADVEAFLRALGRIVREIRKVQET